MVASPRASLDARSLHAVNLPRPLRVRADAAGCPLTVRRRHWPSPRAVVQIQDRWRIDDEWWRDQPISRLYHQVLLDDATLLTLYHDLVSDTWFEQRGQTPLALPVIGPRVAPGKTIRQTLDQCGVGKAVYRVNGCAMYRQHLLGARAATRMPPLTAYGRLVSEATALFVMQCIRFVNHSVHDARRLVARTGAGDAFADGGRIAY